MHSLRLRQLVLGLSQIHYLIVLPALLQVLLEEQELLPLEPLLEQVQHPLLQQLLQRQLQLLKQHLQQRRQHNQVMYLV